MSNVSSSQPKIMNPSQEKNNNVETRIDAEADVIKVAYIYCQVLNGTGSLRIHHVDNAHEPPQKERGVDRSLDKASLWPQCADILGGLKQSEI